MLTEQQLRTLVGLDHEVVACIEEAFVELAAGNVAQPPGLELDLDDRNGIALVKAAYASGQPRFAIKLVSAYFDNPSVGLPSVNGLIVTFDAAHGQIDALLLDNAYLTNIRTAAAGAVAAQHLSRADSRTVAVLGAGTQGRLQLEAVTLVRPIERAQLWAPRYDETVRVAAELSADLGVNVVPASNALDAVRGADIVVTATPSREPIVRSEWITPGQHLTAVGADTADKNELDPSILARSVYVADSLSQTRAVGELHHAVAAALVDADADLAELGSVIDGSRAGRRSPDDLTVADLTGVGAQDAAIASLAAARARMK